MQTQDRKYLASHEWVRLDADLAVVGISDYAQQTLGDITFVEAPTVGQSVSQGKECGSIESVKAAADLFAPLSGVVAAVNDALESDPEIINSDPYEGGWIFKIKDFAEKEMEALLDADAYREIAEAEE